MVIIHDGEGKALTQLSLKKSFKQKKIKNEIDLTTICSRYGYVRFFSVPVVIYVYVCMYICIYIYIYYIYIIYIFYIYYIYILYIVVIMVLWLFLFISLFIILFTSFLKCKTENKAKQTMEIK